MSVFGTISRETRMPNHSKKYPSLQARQGSRSASMMLLLCLGICFGYHNKKAAKVTKSCSSRCHKQSVKMVNRYFCLSFVFALL